MSAQLGAPVELRGECDGDAAAIHAVVRAAFGRPDEADLVDEMRSRGELAVSVVACSRAAVIGHVALSRMRSPPRSMGLAPLSVAPPWQRRGVGSALIGEALAAARARWTATVFVLGHPDFYRRLDFSTFAARPFQSRFAGPHFMALHLDGSGAPSGPARYCSSIEP